MSLEAVFLKYFHFKADVEFAMWHALSAIPYLNEEKWN
jgi:hypothetical protein